VASYRRAVTIILYTYFSAEGFSPFIHLILLLIVSLSLFAFCYNSVNWYSAPRPVAPFCLGIVEYWIDLANRDSTPKYCIRKSFLYKVSMYRRLDLSLHLSAAFLSLSCIMLQLSQLTHRFSSHRSTLSSLLAVNFLNRRAMTDRSAELKANWYR